MGHWWAVADINQAIFHAENFAPFSDRFQRTAAWAAIDAHLRCNCQIFRGMIHAVDRDYLIGIHDCRKLRQGFWVFLNGLEASSETGRFAHKTFIFLAPFCAPPYAKPCVCIFTNTRIVLIRVIEAYTSFKGVTAAAAPAAAAARPPSPSQTQVFRVRSFTRVRRCRCPTDGATLAEGHRTRTSFASIPTECAG